ncbi:MAG: NAD-dependent epimerase/dehydratase family protein [Bacteroidetes bacterium]|nr:NAD-dependent epimerase/dehydratase family protein [Bacteroidota bacterium]
MTVQIDSSKPVMVTGATGYVAGYIVKRLLEEGLTVHATVRDPENKQKLAHLDDLAAELPGNIHYFKADLLDPEAFFSPMKDCELVFHTASPFTSDIKDPQRELIDPALRGTENVLRTASKTPSVKRVVDTSSCAAIYSDATECALGPDGMLTEDMWNTSSSLNYQPYSFSKVLAERRAWELHGEQNQWELITINPSLVMGPPLNPSHVTSDSFMIMKQLVDGTAKMGAPKLGMGIVDVRDVAEAHYRAGFTPEAHGRYITSGHNTNFLDLGKSLLNKYGDKYPLPKRALPKWLVMLVGPMMNKQLTREFIRKNVDVEWKADTSKIKRELNMKFRPLKETMEDMMQALVEAGEV